MTKRTEFEHWKLETNEAVTTWVAARLFTFRRTGVDGYIKRLMLKSKSGKD